MLEKMRPHPTLETERSTGGKELSADTFTSQELFGLRTSPLEPNVRSLEKMELNIKVTTRLHERKVMCDGIDGAL